MLWHRTGTDGKRKGGLNERQVGARRITFASDGWPDESEEEEGEEEGGEGGEGGDGAAATKRRKVIQKHQTWEELKAWEATLEKEIEI